MAEYEKLINALCMWGVSINILVFAFAIFEDLASLQMLSLLNISLLLVRFIIPE